jgi:acyl-CoA thioesterase
MLNSYLKTFLDNDRFASTSGIVLEKTGEGFAVASMKIEPRHMNGAGVVQGGAIFTLADLAFAAAVNSHGIVAVAINVSISYIKAAVKGSLKAEAKEISYSHKLASCTVNVTDDAGELVAVFQGMAYRKKDRLEEMMKDE